MGCVAVLVRVGGVCSCFGKISRVSSFLGKGRRGVVGCEVTLIWK